VDIPLKRKYVARKITKSTTYIVRTGNRHGGTARELKRAKRNEARRRRREYVRSTAPRTDN
jgi:hypothetical protein